MIKPKLLWHLLITAAGGIISLFLAQTYFNFENRTLLDKVFLIIFPAAALFSVFASLLPFYKKQLVRVSTPVQIFLVTWAILTAFSTALPGNRSIMALITLFIVSFWVIAPTAPAIQNLLEASGRRRITGAWGFAIFFSFFIIGFLDDFYTTAIEVALLTLLVQGVASIGGYFLMGRIRRMATNRWVDTLAQSLLLLLIGALTFWLFRTSQQISLFPASHFKLNPGSPGLFIFISMVGLPWQAWLHLRLKFSGFYNQLKQTKVYAYISTNLAGLMLALAFLGLYLVFASVLNEPRFDVDDIYFDADPFNYRLRLTSPAWNDFYWRSVHPFIILLFRPLVFILALPLKGNLLWASFLFIAIGGATCTYLMWTFIRSVGGSSTYASLIATLLGLSASHLVFGSLLESYIFLAASLLLFFLFLLKDRPLPALIAASLLTIGITHANFAQNLIGFFTLKPDIKKVIRFGTAVAVGLVLLTVLNNLLYPKSHPFFFIPATLQAEEDNVYPFNALRQHALLRAFLFQNIAAPTPILHTGEIPFVQFRFFKPEIERLSQYDTPLGNATALIWAGLLALGAGLFLINIRRHPYPRIMLSLAATMAFNLALHLRYGKELFLYSTNWTYALILLLGLTWLKLSDRGWFQVFLLLFLGLLAWNNAQLMRTIIEVLAPQA